MVSVSHPYNYGWLFCLFAIVYSKSEASRLKQEFWKAFGEYMSLIHSADGLKISWVNYKTRIKYLYFRMQANNTSASIAIEISHPQAAIRELFFEQFLQLKNVLANYLPEDWDWQLKSTDEYGKTISRISITLTAVSIFNKADWPVLISFFKPRIIALDEFWSTAKYSFDALK